MTGPTRQTVCNRRHPNAAWWSRSRAPASSSTEIPRRGSGRRRAAGWLALLGGLRDAGHGEGQAGHLVKVNSTASGSVEKGTAYYVIAAREAVDDSTLLYAEAARLVKGALGAKGLTEAPSLAKAAVVVELEYGMAPARVQNRVTVDGVSAPEVERRPDAGRGPTSAGCVRWSAGRWKSTSS